SRLSSRGHRADCEVRSSSRTADWLPTAFLFPRWARSREARLEQALGNSLRNRSWLLFWYNRADPDGPSGATVIVNDSILCQLGTVPRVSLVPVLKSICRCAAWSRKCV